MKIQTPWLLVIGVAFFACRRPAPVGYERPPPDGTAVIDPVDGRRCEKSGTSWAAVIKEKTYYFCTRANFVRFHANPGAFLEP